MHDLRILARDERGASTRYLIEQVPSYQLVRRRPHDMYYIFLPWSYYNYIDFNATQGLINAVAGSQTRRDRPGDPLFQLPIPSVSHWSGLACTRFSEEATTFHERLGLAFDGLFFDPGVRQIDSHFIPQYIPRLLESMNLSPSKTTHATLLKAWEESSPRRVRDFRFDLIEEELELSLFPQPSTDRYTRIALDQFALAPEELLL